MNLFSFYSSTNSDCFDEFQSKFQISVYYSSNTPAFISIIQNFFSVFFPSEDYLISVAVYK